MSTRIFYPILLGTICVAAGLFPISGVAAEPDSATHAASGGDSGSGGVESPIPMSWEAVKKDLALWTGVIFVILFLLLSKFAWKPLAAGLDKREKGIADQIAEAEKAHRQAKELLGTYETRLAQAGEEVKALIAQGRRDAEEAGKELLEKARGETKAEQARSLRQIEAAETAALKNIADRGASLALELAGKIVHAKLSRKEHENLIEQTVSRFAQTTAGNPNVGRN